ncbi:MAG: hypothetical protein ACKOZT_01775 [Cyanobium sp.]
MMATSAALLGLSWLATTAGHALPMSYAGSTTVMVDIDPHWSTISVTRALDRRNGLGVSAQYIPDLQGHNSHSNIATGPGSHAQQGNETFILVDATRLVHRWNLPNAQANLWLFAGLGIYGASGIRELITIPNPQTAARSSSTDNPTSPSPDPIPPSPRPHPHQHLATPVTSPISPTTASAAEIPAYLQFIATTPKALRFGARPGIQFDAETTRLRLEGQALLFLASGIERPVFSATAGAALTEATYTGFQPWLELQARSMPGVVDQLELTPKLRLVHNRVVLEIGYSNLGYIAGGLSYTF